MKTIKRFFKWLLSLFIKKEKKIRSVNLEEQLNPITYDKKYSGKRRFTKTPIYQNEQNSNSNRSR